MTTPLSPASDFSSQPNRVIERPRRTSMTRRRLRGIAGATTLGLTLALPLHAQDQGGGGGDPPAGHPGPEHEFLHQLEGRWEVEGPDGLVVGTAAGRQRLGGRFVELEVHSQTGPVQHAVYTLGFDRRHGDYTISAIDGTGTYAVHARGPAPGPEDTGPIVMYGTDDDPVMAEMGLEKAFAMALEFGDPGRVTLAVRLIDTRTPARTEIPWFAFNLRRPDGGSPGAEAAIRAARDQSNAAIERGDVDGIMSHFDSEARVTAGSGQFIESRDAMRAAFEDAFLTRPDTRYIRTADAVHVSQDGSRASESGTWVGTWTVNGSPQRMGGDYTAQWVLTSVGWKIRSEVFVTLHCQGSGCPS